MINGLKKLVVIPDSFKGTMSSDKICDIIDKAAIKYYPDAQVIKIPVADGGEGTVRAFLDANGGKLVNVKTKGPYFEEVDSFYGLLQDSTAVIEMAASAGLPLAQGRLNPMVTSTYGVGQLIADALDNGAEKIILGLGGSCTNDGGCGAAAALGAKFYNSKNESIIPTGGTLSDIKKIDISCMHNKLKNAQITVMCDIDNPLYGENGAAYVFAPQKGADTAMVEKLDLGLVNLADVILDQFNLDINIKGAGAAGGMGGGMYFFCNAILQMGIETILDTVNFDEVINDADLVITGEGRIDYQSLRGKVISGVAKRTHQKNVPLIAVVGDIGDGIDEFYDIGVTSIFSINRLAIPFEKAKLRSESDLQKTIDNIMRFLKMAHK